MQYYAGGRGFGTTSYYNYAEYFREVNSTTRGSGIPDAIPNTGGGGGSYWATNVNWHHGSGSGGSGIVIVRYLLSFRVLQSKS